MRLSIVYPILNQVPLTRTVIPMTITNLSDDSDAELLILDNGSDIPFGSQFLPPERQKIIRHEENIGVYPTFWDALPYCDGDVIAYLHNDLVICEKGWDKRVLKAFQDDPHLGLVGFIGSPEIDSMGGRGFRTTSNFQGGEYCDNDGLGNVTRFKGSYATIHGFMNNGLTPAMVVDGCAMVFRREVLEKIPQRPNFPPHHFYDRLLSCETREHGYTVAVLGIACDHISGQTVAHEEKYLNTIQAWLDAHGVKLNSLYTHADSALYHEAERQWLSEYRDKKHFIPCHV